jgi:hypothetical protein
MAGHVEGQVQILVQPDAEQIARNDEVSRAGDRQKLGQALNDAE